MTVCSLVDFSMIENGSQNLCASQTPILLESGIDFSKRIGYVRDRLNTFSFSFGPTIRNFNFRNTGTSRCTFLQNKIDQR